MFWLLPAQVRPVTRVSSVTDWSFTDQISQHLFFYSLSLVRCGSLATRILTFMLGKAWPDYLGNEWLIPARCCTFILDQICGPNDGRELHLCIFGHVVSLVSRSKHKQRRPSELQGCAERFHIKSTLCRLIIFFRQIAALCRESIHSRSTSWTG